MNKSFRYTIHFKAPCFVLLMALCLMSTAWAEQKPIVIGGSLPQTGRYADNGMWIERGMKCWAEEVNAKGGLLGRQVVFKIYDDESNPSKAVTRAQKVMTVDKVDLLFGGYPGTAVRAVMPLAEKNKYVYVSMGGHMTSFDRGYTYCFGGPPLMADWWYESFFQWLETLPPDQRPKKAAVLTMNNPIGLSFLACAQRLAKKIGLEIAVEEKYNIPLDDATPLILKAKQASCDILFSNGFLEDGVLTARAAKALEYNPKAFVQAIGSMMPSWPKELGADGNYVFSGTVLHPKLKYPGNDILNEYVKKKFGVNDGYPLYFGFGYCWMQTLGQAVEGAQSLDQTKIRDWLRSNAVQTIGGPLKFDAKGLPDPGNFCLQVLNGRVEIVWPKDVATASPVYPKPHWK